LKIRRKITQRGVSTTESKSRDYYRCMIESSIDPLLTIGPDGKITDVNSATEKITGLSRKKLIGTDFSNYFTDQDKARAGYQQVFCEGLVRDYELGIMHKDGPVTPVLYNASVYRDETGEVIGVFAAARDITERKEAERCVSEVNELNRKIFEILPVGIITYNSSGQCTSANDTAIAVIGATREQLLNQNFRHIESWQKFGLLKVAEEALTRKTVKSTEIHLLSTFGKDVWLDCRLVPFVFGNEPHLLLMFSDMTKHRKAQEERALALAMSEAVKTATETIEGMMDPVMLIDMEGRLTQFNKAFTESLGYGEEVLGTTLTGLVTKEDKGRLNKILRECIRKGFISNFESSIVTKDRQPIPALINLKVMKGSEGNPKSLIVTVRDITDRKHTEDKLKELMDRLVLSNKELEQFAYVASHDLQEPLRMVASFTQLLAKRYHGRLDADADEYINYAVEGASRMQRLINDLLMYSRIGSRGKPFEPVDCSSVLGQAVVNLSAAIEETRAVITNDELPTVMADESQFVQLFQNLLINAIKFHGEVPPLVHISAEKKDRNWLFSVHDNGIGIAPEFKERIFVIFQRLHGKEDYPGTGIGLAICKKIVECHGGRIWVESKSGHGATFCFTIPIKGGK
jgi:PAS domain S-box-containing protein